MCNFSRVQLRRVFRNSALALSAVVEQLNPLGRLDVNAFIPRGAEAGTAGTIDIEEQVAILAKVSVIVIGRDTTSLGRISRVEKLRAEYQDIVYMVTSYGETNHQAIQLPVYKASKARFINNDLEDWSTTVYDAALSAKSNWHEPPGIDEMPGAMAPTWAKIGAYNDAGGGLENGEIHKEQVVPREKGGGAVKRARRDDDPSQLPCFGWASRWGCRFERNGGPYKNRHDPADKFREQNESGGGACGAAHKKPKADVRTVPSASASGDGVGSGKGGGSAQPSKGDDE